MTSVRMLSCAGFAALSLAAAAASQTARGADPLVRVGLRRDAYQQVMASLPDAEQASFRFLVAHMPVDDFDVVAPALLVENVQLAHAAREQVRWGKALPDELFCGYVLPYAQATEAREAWRAEMVQRFLPRVMQCATPGEAAQQLNETVFDELNVHYSTERRRADQAPSASIEQGKASCTGLSILLADACRACCVPARLVSVRWPHKPGNHTWVEVWDGEAWRFCGADEPDPKGLDRGWFTGDAAQCADADRAHRVWAVSFAETGERFVAGWTRDQELWGIDVSARYAKQPAAATGVGSKQGDDALLAQLARWFAADEARRKTFEFDRNLDESLKTAQGDARLRALVWQALQDHERAVLQKDHDARVVRAGGKESPYTVEEVGKRGEGKLGLVIAMHGGGGVPKKFNDSQWRHMQVYYHDHPEAGSYLYCALRAPTDEWNGFYTDYFYPVLEKLIRQFVVCEGVDPDKVVAIGYSHGGYGAFALGPKLPHRFAAVHASAAAPTDGQSSPIGLHTLEFSFMVGGKDTAYGRRERCEAFAAQLEQLQKNPLGGYPTTFTLVEGNGHTGLPDRDLLAQLVPLERTPLPQWVTWQPTDGTVKDHYWLRCEQPKPGAVVTAVRKGQRLVVDVEGEGAFDAWLDARLFDLQKPLTIVAGKGEREVRPQPSLRTLCHTMAERGDPVLAASWIVPLR